MKKIKNFSFLTVLFLFVFSSTLIVGQETVIETSEKTVAESEADQIDENVDDSIAKDGETIDKTEKTSPTDADNPGLSFLEQAVDEKLKASTLQDIGRVISLAQRARKEGLSGANLKFCDELIASEQLQRGLVLSQALIGKPPEQLGQGWNSARIRILNDLEAAVKILKDQPLAYLRIAQLNLLPDGDTKRANEALGIVEKLGKDDPNIFSQVKILKAMLEKDPIKQEAIIAEASKANPNPRLLLLLAKSQMDLKQYSEALKTLEKTLELDPTNLQALFAVFDVYSKQGEYEKALKALDVLDEEAPDDKWKLERARLLANMGRNVEAIEILDQLREKNQDNPAILGIRAAVHLETKEYEKALKDIDAALRLAPRQMASRVLKAQILISMERFDEATALIEEICKDEPENEDLPISLIQLYVSQKKFDEAIKVVDKLMEKTPDNERWTVLKAQVHIDQKEFDKAIELLKQFDEKHPDSVRTKLFLVTLFADQKKSRDALHYLESLIEKDPDSIDLLRLRANLLLGANRHKDAAKALERVIEMDPKDEVSTNNLSWLLSTSPIDMVRNGQRALELAKKACEMTEYKKSYILSTLAAAYAETGDFDKAVEWSQKSIDMAQDDENVRDRVDELKKELEAYQKKQPYREVSEEDDSSKQ